MTSAAEKLALQQTGLYDPSQEHDACGVGFVAHINCLLYTTPSPRD